MNISRRGFLGAILAASAAPAICKVENLMKIAVPFSSLILPEDYKGYIDSFRINTYNRIDKELISDINAVENELNGDFTLEWWTGLKPNTVNQRHITVIRENNVIKHYVNYQLVPPPIGESLSDFNKLYSSEEFNQVRLSKIARPPMSWLPAQNLVENLIKKHKAFKLKI